MSKIEFEHQRFGGVYRIKMERAGSVDIIEIFTPGKRLVRLEVSGPSDDRMAQVYVEGKFHRDVPVSARERDDGSAVALVDELAVPFESEWELNAAAEDALAHAVVCL